MQWSKYLLASFLGFSVHPCAVASTLDLNATLGLSFGLKQVGGLKSAGPFASARVNEVFWLPGGELPSAFSGVRGAAAFLARC